MTTIAYSVSDLLFGRINRKDMQRSVERAVAEWNRVMEGLVVFVPRRKGAKISSVLITFGNQYKGPPAPEGAMVEATCIPFPGKLDPRWVIELKDNPKLNWVPYPSTRFGRWFRRVFGTQPGSTPITSVLLHELGHVIQLPHEEKGIDDLVMSLSCAKRDAINRMEAARYRTWFENYVVTQQHD